jgi:acetylornithine/N-succinyldiaminopimelate aminotransferase
VSEPAPALAGDREWADRHLQMNHYGPRLPFGSRGGTGLVQRFVELDGPDAGREFEVLDASGGYASACLGAGSPVIAGALAEAVRTAGYVTDEIASAARSRLLTSLFGAGGLFADAFGGDDYHVSGRNSGSEGMELALRLCLESRFDRRRLRPLPGRAERNLIVAFEGAWHGWTGGLLPLLNRRHYRVGLPDLSGGPHGVTVQHLPYGEPDAAREFLAAHGDRVLAVVVEPVQGDAGILVPPPGYLRDLAGLCRRHGALLIADEVLTFAKTGRFFAMADDEGPIPTDVTVICKSLGMGALSTSMVIARRDLSARETGAVTTSDLRPLTCAAIQAGLEHLASEKLVDRAADLGAVLTETLRDIAEAFPGVYREARGTGVLHGVELTEAAAQHLGDLRIRLIRHGVYVEFMSGAGRRSRGLRYLYPTMRVAPPLVATPADVRELARRIAAGTREFAGTLP